VYAAVYCYIAVPLLCAPRVMSWREMLLPRRRTPHTGSLAAAHPVAGAAQGPSSGTTAVPAPMPARLPVARTGESAA